MNLEQKDVVPLPGAFHQYRTMVGDALRRQFPERDPEVYNLLRFHMGWSDEHGRSLEAQQGKALRPTLCLFACEAAGGDPEDALPAAVAVEYVHNFSLIHDDIQDQDDTRHGRETLWHLWGLSKAVVAGNTLRVIADTTLHELVNSGLRPALALEVAETLTESYLEMIEGQFLDLKYEGRQDIGTDRYLEMISKKTGALFRCSVNLGAMIGTDDKRTLFAFREFGRQLGYVFQIRDDVLGVWGEHKSTGKPVNADIRRRKNSFPVMHAMSQAQGEDKLTLSDIYSGETGVEITGSDVEAVLGVMDRVGTRKFAQSIAIHHRDAALDALTKVKMTPEARQGIEELADFLLIRQH